LINLDDWLQVMYSVSHSTQYIKLNTIYVSLPTAD